MTRSVAAEEVVGDKSAGHQRWSGPAVCARRNVRGLSRMTGVRRGRAVSQPGLTIG